MYPLILSFETINKLNLFFECVLPDLKMWDTSACTTAIFLTYFIFSIVVLENVPPDAGLQKRDTFSTRNVGLAGTRSQILATCVASCGTAQPSTSPYNSGLSYYKLLVLSVKKCSHMGLPSAPTYSSSSTSWKSATAPS
jgi:hypothetical protein